MTPFRLDRFTSLHVFHPLEKACSPSNVAVPILMYHSIASDGEKHLRPYYQTTTRPERFEEQMRLLHEAGYSTVSLESVIRRIENPSVNDSKMVAITFDDGFEDFYTNAFPILARYGFIASMFLPTVFVGRSVHGRRCLNWQQVKELSTAGIIFGSHTATHPQLHVASKSEQTYELQDSKDTIEQAIGARVRSFSYPYAFPEQDRRFTEQLKEGLIRCGYANGVSTTIGRAAPGDEIFFLKRLPINDADDPQLFFAKLDGGYDWFHAVQYASKFIRWEIKKWRFLRAVST